MMERSQRDIDEERGFTQAEYEACLRVLTAFQTRLELLNSKEYRPLRTAGLIFVDGISKKYFRGLSPAEYNHKKARKAELKKRRMEQEAADRQRLQKAKSYKRKLVRLEKLMAVPADPLLDDSDVALPRPLSPVSDGRDGILTTASGVAALAAEHIISDPSIGYSRAGTARKRKRRKHHRRRRSKRSPSPLPSGKGGNQDMDDAGSRPSGQSAEADDKDERTSTNRLHRSVECYICKTDFWFVHSHYDQLCPPCADLNWEKRAHIADLSDRVMLVTGCRIKIGFEVALKALRCGATVIGTTRFPKDAARRFAAQEDFDAWGQRLHVYGLDLRVLSMVEGFCTYLVSAYARLDIIINNAAQTIRRPPMYYEHLLVLESIPWDRIPSAQQAILQPPSFGDTPWRTMADAHATRSWGGSCRFLSAHSASAPSSSAVCGRDAMVLDLKAGEFGLDSSREVMALSSVLSQVPLLPEDQNRDPGEFPPAVLDEHEQQIDLREKNSWVMGLADVHPAELAEVHIINAMAPFMINSKLLPLLTRSPARHKFIINVSSAEGEFYHRKTTAHPHTNMAKASLNMLTRTSAPELARHCIYMNSVDTGWVSDMNPIEKQVRIADKYGFFNPPIDEVDGAARILDPIFSCLNGADPEYGRFLKDYKRALW